MIFLFNTLAAFFLDTLGILLPLKFIHKLTKSSQFVLLFHNVADQSEVNYFNANLNFEPQKFIRFLELLRKLEYQTLPLASIDKSTGNRAVYLTFDDGYPSWVNNVLPILNEREIPATFFVSSGLITGEAYMWWSEIDTLSTAKIGIFKELEYRKVRNKIASAGSVPQLKSLLETYGLKF